MAVTVDIFKHNVRRKTTGEGPVKQAVITIPSGDVDTDVTIVTPSTGQCIFIVGMIFSENNAMNFKIKYAASKYHTFELAANQGIFMPVGNGMIPIPQDFPLVVQASADFTDLSIFYIEAEELLIHQ